MYAIIETGGKQYRVQKNDILAVEKLSAKGGDKVQFNTVLLTGGEPVSYTHLTLPTILLV